MTAGEFLLIALCLIAIVAAPVTIWAIIIDLLRNPPQDDPTDRHRE